MPFLSSEERRRLCIVAVEISVLTSLRRSFAFLTANECSFGVYVSYDSADAYGEQL
jgi:hypothetical protein